MSTKRFYKTMTITKSKGIYTVDGYKEEFSNFVDCKAFIDDLTKDMNLGGLKDYKLYKSHLKR